MTRGYVDIAGSDYGSEPVEELTRVATDRIPVGEEVFSEDFAEQPTDPELDLTSVAELLTNFDDEPTKEYGNE